MGTGVFHFHYKLFHRAVLLVICVKLLSCLLTILRGSKLPSHGEQGPLLLQQTRSASSLFNALLRHPKAKPGTHGKGARGCN